MQILISASKREPTGLGRSISLCSLGIFLYKEFLNRSDSHRIKDVVNILVAGTKVGLIGIYCFLHILFPCTLFSFPILENA